jgi:hypothetical protein
MLTFPRVYDLVEDRTLSHQSGVIVYFVGNYRGDFVCIRFSDGSEEEVAVELLRPYRDNHWTI